jgi:hypothetical protein
MNTDLFSKELLLPLVQGEAMKLLDARKLSPEQAQIYQEASADLIALTLIIMRSGDPVEVEKAKGDMLHVKATLNSIQALRKRKAVDTTIKAVGTVLGTLIKAGIKAALPL